MKRGKKNENPKMNKWMNGKWFSSEPKTDQWK